MGTILKEPSLYDLLYDDVDEDINFYVKLLEGYPTIVEYGAGSGRITIPLLHNNHRVIAIDNEPLMLKRLQDKLEKQDGVESNRIELLCADIVNLRFEEKQECILVPFTTFNYLMTAVERYTCLSNIAKSLKVGGIAVFELLTLNTYPELGCSDDLIYIKTIQANSDTYIEYSRQTYMDVETDTIYQNRVFQIFDSAGVGLSRLVYEWKNHYVSLEDFQTMAEKCNLVVEKAYGNCDFSTYSSQSNDLFVVLRNTQ